jgi:hypothetical protein
MTDSTVIPEALKKASGRPRKYATDQERRLAHNKSNKNYTGKRAIQQAQAEAQKNYEAQIAACRTVQEFWTVNRAKDTDVVAALQPQVELAAHQFYWMNSGWRFADDPDYVDLREGTADLDRFIRQQDGLIKEVKFSDPELAAFVPQYAVWRDFWRDAEMFEALVKENEPTAIFAKYGLAVSIFEYAHLVWSQNIRRHRETSSNIAARAKHVEFDGDRCWLCRYAKFHGVEYDQQLAAPAG